MKIPKDLFPEVTFPIELQFSYFLSWLCYTKEKDVSQENATLKKFIKLNALDI